MQFHIDMIQLCHKLTSPGSAGNTARALATEPCIGGAQVLVEHHSTPSLPFSQHPDDIRRAKNRASSAAWRAAHPEKHRAYNAHYRATHRESLRVSKAAYRAAHPEKSIQWHAANPEKSRAKNKKWRANHPEAVRAFFARRRARKAHAAVNDLTSTRTPKFLSCGPQGSQASVCGIKQRQLA